MIPVLVGYEQSKPPGHEKNYHHHLLETLIRLAGNTRVVGVEHTPHGAQSLHLYCALPLPLLHPVGLDRIRHLILVFAEYVEGDLEHWSK